MKTKSGYLVREPYGVIGIISPWELSLFNSGHRKPGSAGRRKCRSGEPSEFTSLTAIELASLLHQAGLPQDVFRVIVGDGATGAALINAAIDKLVFTGSVPTGKQIAQAAAARLLPVVLELGGRTLCWCSTTPMSTSPPGARYGAHSSMPGRPVSRSSVCYVHRSLYSPFLEACVRHTERLRVGNGMESKSKLAH